MEILKKLLERERTGFTIAPEAGSERLRKIINKNLTNEDILNIHKALKTKSSAPLLYGGSVKVNNAKEILSLENVDGVLVGSAALCTEDFCTMCEYAQKLEKN